MHGNNIIYLAGNGRDIDFALEYRKQAAIYLPNWKCLNPFRHKQHENNRWLYGTPGTSSSEVVVRDIWHDLKNCKLALMEMVLDDYNYIGSNHESAYATIFRIPMIWIVHPNYINHPFVKEHGAIHFPATKYTFFDVLPEACAYINKFYGECYE